MFHDTRMDLWQELLGDAFGYIVPRQHEGNELVVLWLLTDENNIERLLFSESVTANPVPMRAIRGRHCAIKAALDPMRVRVEFVLPGWELRAAYKKYAAR